MQKICKYLKQISFLYLVYFRVEKYTFYSDFSIECFVNLKMNGRFRDHLQFWGLIGDLEIIWRFYANWDYMQWRLKCVGIFVSVFRFGEILVRWRFYDLEIKVWKSMLVEIFGKGFSLPTRFRYSTIKDRKNGS